MTVITHAKVGITGIRRYPSLMTDIIAFIEYVWFPFAMFATVAYLLLKALWDA